MSQEQTTFSFNEELNDNASDKVSIQLSSEVININYYQLFKWSKLVREEYPKNEINRLSSYICQIQQKYNINQENIKSFFNSISNEQIQITIDKYFDYLKLSKILSVEMVSRILQKFAQNHCNDVIFILKSIHDQLSSQKDENDNDLVFQILPEMEEVLSKNVDQCLQTPEFGEIPIPNIYRILKQCQNPIPSDLIYKFIKDSIDSRYILFIFLNVKELSSQNLSDLIETLSKTDDPKWKRYSQYIEFDFAYLNEILKEKNQLQSKIDQLNRENDQLKIDNENLSKKSVFEPGPIKIINTSVTISKPNKKIINVAVVGHISSGKSTLVGNLLCKSGFISSNEFKQIEDEANKQGKHFLKYAFVSDKLEEERESGLTIKCSSSFIETSKYYFRIIDTPGNPNYIGDLMNGISQADMVILVVDSSVDLFGYENLLTNQTKNLSLISFTLGVKPILVAVNKIDDKSVNYDKNRYKEIADKMSDTLINIGYKSHQFAIIPISGFNGDNLITSSSKLLWWKDLTLLETLDKLGQPNNQTDKSLRFIVQHVYTKNKDTVIIGTVECGVLKQGQSIVFSPSNIKANIISIEMNNEKINEAFPGYYVEIRIDAPAGNNEIKCGFVCGDPSSNPPTECANFTGNLIISNYPKKIYEGYKGILYCNSTHVPCKFVKLIKRTDRTNGNKIYKNPKWIQRNDIGLVVIEPLEPISIEEYNDFPSLGRLVVQDMNLIVAVGIVVNVQKK